MTIISRYIGITIIKFIFLVLLVVFGMDFFILLISEFSDIGKGSYGILQAIEYVVLTVPGNLYSLFPMVVLLGSLVGLGTLGSHSELIIMRSAGLSVKKIVLFVLQAAFFLIVAMTIVGEWVAPVAQHVASQQKIMKESAGKAVETAGGIWLKENNTFVNIEKVLPHEQLEGITQYQFNEQQELTSLIAAKSAKKEGGQWQLQNVSLTEFSANKLTSQARVIMPWDFQINPRLLGISKGNVVEMNLKDLHHYIQFRHRNGLTSGTFSLAFWQRIFQPFSSLVMIFLAVPFIFGPLRSVTMGVRIVTGALLGFSFYILNQFLGPASLVYQIPPILGALLPTLLFMLLAIFLMRRVH